MDLNDVKMLLRSLILTSKSGVELSKLRADYLEECGQEIPYKKFGFTSLIDFLQSIPDAVKLSQHRGGSVLIQSVSTDETSHIEKLIKGQKKSKSDQKRRPVRIIGRKNASYPGNRGLRQPVNKTNGHNKSSNNNQERFNTASVNNKSRDTSAPLYFGNIKSTAVNNQPESPPIPSVTFSSSSHQSSRSNARVTSKSSSVSSVSSPPPLPPQSTNYYQSSGPANCEPLTSLTRTICFENRNKSLTSGVEELTLTDSSTAVNNVAMPVPSGQRRGHRAAPLSSSSSPSSSSPTSYQGSPGASKTVTTNYKKELEEFASKYNLSRPIYRIINVGGEKAKRVVYIAKVRIDDQDWTSHPSTFSTPIEAEEGCSLNALKSLKKSLDVLTKATPSGQANDADEEQLVSRIIELLKEDQFHSIRSSAIGQLYAKKYKTALPANWLEMVKKHKERIVIEEHPTSNANFQTVGLPANNPKKPPFKSIDTANGKNVLSRNGSSPSTPTTPSTSFDRFIYDGDVNSQVLPETLLLPGTETWDVIVSKIISTEEVILRLLDLNDDYVDLVESMHNHYTQKPNPVERVIYGKIYVASFPQEETTLRVQAIEDTSSGKILCLLVDVGGFEEVAKEDLYEIEKQFLTLSFQAFPVQMAGLVQYGSNPEATRILEKRIDAIEHKMVIVVPENTDYPIKVHIYDVSGEEDLNINDEIHESMKRLAFHSLTTRVGKRFKGTPVDCHPDGFVFIQFQGDFLDKVTEKQTEVNVLCSNSEFSVSLSDLEKSLGQDDIYYALYDGNWYRAVIKSLESNGEVVVEYVDYGNNASLKPENIKKISPEKDPLDKIPFIAVKCLLDAVPADPDLKWTDRASQKLFTLFDAGEVLWIKIIKPVTETTLPTIELYREVRGEYTNLNMKLCSFKECFDLTPSASDESPKSKKVIPEILKPRIVSPSSTSNNINSASIAEKDSSMSPPITDSFSQASQPTGHDTPTRNITTTSPSIEPQPSILSGDEVIGSFDPIPPPSLPSKTKSPILIEVTQAFNPHRFSVRLLDDTNLANGFTQLKANMKEFYELEENKIELGQELIREGHYYAVKYEDEWCRARVVNAMPTMCCMVDNGEIRQVDLSNIQPLYTPFRRLPMLAIRATLCSIKPKSLDWDPISSITFCEMVRKKCIKAHLDSIIKIDGEAVLQLTFDKTDNNVEDLLVNRNFAIKNC